MSSEDVTPAVLEKELKKLAKALDKFWVNISSIDKRIMASVNITIFASYLCSSLFHARVRMIVCSRSVAVNKLSI